MARSFGSMIHIPREEPSLQRRAVYQGLAFAVFNMVWTAAPLVLARTFAFDQKAIALFALAGAGGALAAPLAGRLGDRGHVRLGTAVALLTLTASALASGWAAAIGSVALLVVFAIALDAAVQVNQAPGQRVIYALRGEARGRINALYTTIVFVLGAGGSAIATLAWRAGGWRGAMLAAAVIGALDVALFATELRKRE